MIICSQTCGASFPQIYVPSPIVAFKEQGMQIDAGNVRRGAVVDINGDLFLVTKTEFRNPGNWRAILQITLKNLRTGNSIEQRFRPQDKLTIAYVEERAAEYLYFDGKNYVFMFSDDYDQVQLPAEILGDDGLLLLPNTPVKVRVYDGKPVSVELPNSVKHKVVQADPAIKGATAQAQYKPAVTETGLKIMVPPFINAGDVIEIDTRTGEYLARA
jgi:elongation factor P